MPPVFSIKTPFIVLGMLVAMARVEESGGGRWEWMIVNWLDSKDLLGILDTSLLMGRDIPLESFEETAKRK